MKLLTSLFIVLVSFKVGAAACCGGGWQFPSMILGDDKAQLSLSMLQTQITDDVTPDGIWFQKTTPDVAKTLRLDGAHILSDRFQIGVSLPLIQTAHQWGVGDSNLVGVYEILPEFDYSSWKPKGVWFLNLTIPSGNSIYDARLTTIAGRGFWNLSTGFLLSKIIGSFDFLLLGEIHKPLDRESNGNLIIPGWGRSASVGGGYNLEKWRLGALVTTLSEDPIVSSGTINSRGAIQNFTNLSVQLNYLLDPEFTITAAYADQTLLGNPSNAALGHSYVLSMTKRWQR